MSEIQRLSVTLPGDVLYVTGTINGETTTWTNTGGRTWESIAKYAQDGEYHIELTILNNDGNVSTASTTAYYGTTALITDRRQQDVSLRTKKGFYNATDLNRVGAAVEYLEGRLDAHGIAVDVEPKTDWLIRDIPSLEQMRRYLHDVEEMRQALPPKEGTPKTPESMSNLDWQKANDIEKILVNLDETIRRIRLSYWYSGEIYTGEV